MITDIISEREFVAIMIVVIFWVGFFLGAYVNELYKD